MTNYANRKKTQCNTYVAVSVIERQVQYRTLGEGPAKTKNLTLSQLQPPG